MSIKEKNRRYSKTNHKQWKENENVIEEDIDDILQLESNNIEVINETNETARKGRRAREPVTEAQDASIDEVLSSSGGGNSTNTMIDAEVKTNKKPASSRRRMSGWATSDVKKNDDDDERLKISNTKIIDDDSDNDIPVIPDLEDSHIGGDNLSSQTTRAPNVAVNRLAAYRELDNDLLRHASFLTLDNEIDLKLLAQCLSSENDVTEDSKSWEWERLFTEVTSELLTEWEDSNVDLGLEVN